MLWHDHGFHIWLFTLQPDSNYTPKVRGRSFSVRKFKRKKSFKGEPNPSFQSYQPFSPLPNKPQLDLVMATPKSPASMDFPNQGCDILSPEQEATKNSQLVSDEPSTSAFEDVVEPMTAAKDEVDTQTKEPVLKRSTSRGGSEYKIGMMRTRSQDLSRKSLKMEAKPFSMESEKGCNYLDSRDGGTLNKSNSITKPPKELETSRNESLSNLRADISSFIEKSFSTDPAETQSSFEDKAAVNKPRALRIAQRASAMRRQSSAFEFKCKSNDFWMPPTNMRRQSSAFEIAARNRQQYNVADSFNRVETRASLRRKNSSVKDLVKKLEASNLKEKEKQLPMDEDEASNPFEPMNEDDAVETEEWMDASEFFKNPLPVRHLLAEEDLMTSGSKRSSIIRIRTERKGLVSKSVESFTRPPSTLMPPPPLRPALMKVSLSSCHSLQYVLTPTTLDAPDSICIQKEAVGKNGYFDQNCSYSSGHAVQVCQRKIPHHSGEKTDLDRHKVIHAYN